MKASIQKSVQPPFQPRSITIVFESQKELDAFGKLFNTAAVASVMREAMGINEFAPNTTPIYDLIEELGGAINPSLHDQLKKVLY